MYCLGLLALALGEGAMPDQKIQSEILVFQPWGY
jgi:hypothetical protein